MDIEQVRDFTLSLNGVTEDQPFGDDNITFRLEGKIFLCLWLGDDGKDVEPHFALKMLPERNEELRDAYPTVCPAWHWNKRHWSDVYYSTMDADTVSSWIEESYRLIVSKLPREKRSLYI